MSDRKKKRMLFAALSMAALLIVLGILCIITKAFALQATSHILGRLLCTSIIIRVLKKCFYDQLGDRTNKVIAACGCVTVADLVIVDAIRYILSSGTSTVLFLPGCLPICFMIVMANSVGCAGAEKTELKSSAYLIGIPLLLLSLYFEVLSFLQIL
jgi:hypothetical protein